MGKLKNYQYAILVNSCDKFEDCWEPFFLLFGKYWSGFEGRIYLNTEYSNYSNKNMDITSLKVCEIKQDRDKITWSECLMRALEKIEEDVILYLQEDYFIKDFVKEDIINKYSALMSENLDIDCIHLTDQAVFSDKLSSEKYEGLNPAIIRQRFRVSCQAALWRKEVLLNYLRQNETAWEFEEFASKRSVYKNHNFYVVDDNIVKLNKFEIIPYIFTGIIQGRWKEEIQVLFESHGISVDFSIRGFVGDAPKKTLMEKIKYMMNRIPILLKHYKEMYIKA